MPFLVLKPPELKRVEWRFTPEQPWSSGRQKIFIDPELETLPGTPHKSLLKSTATCRRLRQSRTGSGLPQGRDKAGILDGWG